VVFPLPDAPHMEHFKAQAKTLRESILSGDPAAVDRLTHMHPRYSGMSRENISDVPLTHAQLVIAREYGFASWQRIRDYVDDLHHPDVPAAWAAVTAGDLSTVRKLLDRRPSLISVRNDRHTLLHHAAARNQPEIVRFLLDRGAEIDALNRHPDNDDPERIWTPVHFGASMGAMEAVRVLLDAGARTDIGGATGETALAAALFYGHAEIGGLLATHQLLPDNLRIAAGLGRIDLMERHIAPDGSLRPSAFVGRQFYRPHDGFPDWTPTPNGDEVMGEALTYAFRNSRVEAADWLLARGVNIDARPYRGSSSLHWCAMIGNRPMVELLLERGADPKLVDDHYNGIPAGWAYYNGHPELAPLLSPELSFE